MSNTVAVDFLGRPQHLFATADAVEARLLALRTRLATAATLPLPANTLHQLTAREVQAANNLKTLRHSNEKLFTAYYLTQLKAREAAEVASIGRLGAARASAMSGGNVSGAASSAASGRAGAAAAGAGAGLGIGLGAALGAGVGLAAVMTLKGSISAYEDHQKKLNQLSGQAQTVRKDLEDLFALRGMDKSASLAAISEMNEGIANSAVLGKNASVALDVYASRLGKTANELTRGERQQALFNEALAQAARNAGAATLNLTPLEQQSAALNKTWKDMLVTLGGFTTPAVVGALSLLNQLMGGSAELSPAAQQDTAASDWAKRQQQIAKDFQQMQKDLSSAQQNPTGSLLNLALTRFANRDQLLGGSPEQREDARRIAIENAKEYVDAFASGIKANIGISTLPELRELSKQVFDMRNVMPFDQWKSLSQEIQAAITQQVDQAKTKVKELGETYRSTFANLAAQSNTDNPFVKVFMDANREIDELKQNIRGLPPEMQKAALESQRAFNAKQLFGARADNAMAAFDLREIALRFRDDTASRRAFAESAFASEKAEFERRLALGGMNEDAVRDYLDRQRRFIDNNFQGETSSDRLERQFQALDRLNPQNSAERAILDQRVLRIAQSIDPENLRGDLRERVAQTAERQAEREERRFQEALQVQQEQLATQKALLKVQENLMSVAQARGVAGIDQALSVTIKDETGRATVESRGSSDDVAVRYGSYSGGGGLTSF